MPYNARGHVDCTGEIVDKYTENDSLWIRVRVPAEYLKFIVPKGFIAIDGTSLTVCDADTASSTFSFMLIAHTQSNVIIPQKVVGERVNVEVDVLAKMVVQSLGNAFERLDMIERTLEQLRGNKQ